MSYKLIINYKYIYHCALPTTYKACFSPDSVLLQEDRISKLTLMKWIAPKKLNTGDYQFSN